MRNEKAYVPETAIEFHGITYGTEHNNARIITFINAKDQPCAVGWQGKRSKPDFYYNFRNIENRKIYIDKYLNGIKDKMVAHIERKKKFTQYTHNFKVGDVLYSSWGYDQTNIDFYQVVEIISTKMILIREIHSKYTSDNNFNDRGSCIADISNFKNKEPLRKRVGLGDYVRLTTFSSASKWDGEPKYWSSYA